jgi:hypothetical protein
MLPYTEQIKIEINTIAEKNIYDDINEIYLLSDKKSNDVIKSLIKYACWATNDLLIILSRNLFSSMKKEWVSSKIKLLAEDVIDFNDEWEYRRLLELADIISEDLLEWAIKKSVGSYNEEVLEAANDFLTKQ